LEAFKTLDHKKVFLSKHFTSLNLYPELVFLLKEPVNTCFFKEKTCQLESNETSRSSSNQSENQYQASKSPVLFPSQRKHLGLASSDSSAVRADSQDADILQNDLINELRMFDDEIYEPSEGDCFDCSYGSSVLHAIAVSCPILSCANAFPEIYAGKFPDIQQCLNTQDS